MFNPTNIVNELKKINKTKSDNITYIINKLENTDNTKNIYTKEKLTNLPNIFVEYNNITSVNYRDTYMINTNKKITYYRKKSILEYVGNNVLIEKQEINTVVPECFPNLIKYDNVQQYTKFDYKLNTNIIICAIKIKDNIFIEIHIKDIKDVKLLDIKNINKLLQSNNS